MEEGCELGCRIKTGSGRSIVDAARESVKSNMLLMARQVGGLQGRSLDVWHCKSQLDEGLGRLVIRSCQHSKS